MFPRGTKLHVLKATNVKGNGMHEKEDKVDLPTARSTEEAVISMAAVTQLSAAPELQEPEPESMGEQHLIEYELALDERAEMLDLLEVSLREREEAVEAATLAIQERERVLSERETQLATTAPQ
mmetsp:Transcript_78657/g.156382  ORF Transcript_78657/g.156382 Transcript_78657/m.156382 type:complete len:124 (-) Transcript_78657:344-715(-)